MKRLLSWIIVIISAILCNLWATLLLKILTWGSSILSGLSIFILLLVWSFIGGLILWALFGIASLLAAFAVSFSQNLCPSRRMWRFRIIAWTLIIFCVYNVYFYLTDGIGGWWWIIPQSQLLIYSHFLLRQSSMIEEIEYISLPFSERVTIPLTVAFCIFITFNALIIIGFSTGFISIW